MIIRPAEREDVPALARVAAASWAAAFAGILEPDALASRDEAFFAERFGNEWEKMCVAVDAEGMAGFSLVTGEHVDMLFVDPAKAGRGVGGLLLQHAEQGCARSLECFRDNLPARRFYEHAGWKESHLYDREFLGRTRAFVRYERG